jgi:hypothetical protein
LNDRPPSKPLAQALLCIYTRAPQKKKTKKNENIRTSW